MKSSYLFLIAVGILAGILCGLFGVGGGVVIVLFISMFLSQDQHIAQATAISITFIAAIISTVIYAMHGNLQWLFIIPITIGSVIGGYIGANLMNKIPSKYLQRFFGIFMMLAGIRMVF